MMQSYKICLHAQLFDEVADPIEQAVRSVTGVTKVSSSSTTGSTNITVEWDYGLDDDKVLADISNAVNAVKSTLPDEVTTNVTAGSSDDIPVIALAVVFLRPGSDDARLTASFPRTVSIYEGSAVRILGVPVGQVDTVTPAGTTVEVDPGADYCFQVQAYTANGLTFESNAQPLRNGVCRFQAS